MARKRYPLRKRLLPLEDLPRECRILRYTGDRYVSDGKGWGSWEPEDPYTLSELSYGDLTPDDAGEFVELPLCGGSDYSGSLVEKSNHRVLLEEYGKLPGVWSVYGGYNTFSLVVSRRQWCSPLWEEVRHLVDDYPLADEEALSNLEMDEQDEGWESWVRSDFTSEVSKVYRVDLSECKDEDLRQLFEDTREKANVYWHDEGMGSGMYVDVSRVVKALDRDACLALAGAIDEDREDAIADEVASWEPYLDHLVTLARRQDATVIASGVSVPITPTESLARALLQCADSLGKE